MKASILMLSLITTAVAAGPALAKPVKAPVRTPVGLGANVSTTPRQPSLTKEQRIHILCASGRLSGVACTAIPIKKG